jgi:hypothetical protein
MAPYRLIYKTLVASLISLPPNFSSPKNAQKGARRSSKSAITTVIGEARDNRIRTSPLCAPVVALPEEQA